MVKQKIEEATDSYTAGEYRTLLKLSGKSLQEQLGLTDADIEAGKNELDPMVREKLEGMKDVFEPKEVNDANIHKY